jgi:hypothetical protein
MKEIIVALPERIKGVWCSNDSTIDKGNAEQHRPIVLETKNNYDVILIDPVLP